MKHCRQRRTLSACRQISSAKVVHDGHAERLRQPGRFAQLQGGASASHRIVKNSLPVKSDQRRLAAGMFGVEAPEIMVQLADLMRVCAAARSRMESYAKRCRKVDLPVFAQLDALLANIAQRVIHAVDACAGHDSENAHGTE